MKLPLSLVTIKMKKLLSILIILYSINLHSQDEVADKESVEDINYYTQLIKQNPDSGFLYLMRASLYQEEEKYLQSKVDAEKAIDLEGFNPWGHLFLARSYYYGDNNLEKGVKSMNAAIDMVQLTNAQSPNQMYLYIEISQWYYEKNQEEKALSQLLKARLLDRDHYRINYELAQHYFFYKKDYDKALHYINLALDKNKYKTKTGEIYFVVDMKVQILCKLRRFDEASKLVQPFLKIDDTESDAHISASEIYQSSGRFDLARKEIYKAEKAEPSIDRSFNRANVERAELKFDEYLFYIKKHLEGKDVDAYYFGSLAGAYSELNDYDKSDEYHKKSIEESGENPHYYNSYAYFLARTNRDLQKADSLIDIAVNLEPGNIFYEDTYCFIKSMRGDIHLALDYYEKNKDIKRKSFDVIDHPYFKGYKVIQYHGEQLEVDSIYYDGWVQVSLLGDTMNTFYLLNPSDEDLHATSYFNYKYTFDKLEIEGGKWTSYEEELLTEKQIDIEPNFVGGNEAMDLYFDKRNLNPESKELQEGQLNAVYVRFVVTSMGDVIQVTVLRGIEYSIDKKVIESVEAMPKWNPALKNGEAVDCIVTIPVFVKSR